MAAFTWLRDAPIGDRRAGARYIDLEQKWRTRRRLQLLVRQSAAVTAPGGEAHTLYHVKTKHQGVQGATEWRSEVNGANGVQLEQEKEKYHEFELYFVYCVVRRTSHVVEGSVKDKMSTTECISCLALQRSIRP